MSFLPGSLISHGMAPYHTFPFGQFISPIPERDLEASEPNNFSGPYKKLKTQNINGYHIPDGTIVESRQYEEEDFNERNRRGYVSHSQNGSVNLINQRKDSRENIQPNQNAQPNNSYPGYGHFENPAVPFTFVSGFLTTVQPVQPSTEAFDSNNFSSLNAVQNGSFENQQFSAISLSDLSAMKTDWFRAKYAESQDPMWAYLLEQQEDFLSFTNKITEIISICSLPTENTVFGDLSQINQREGTSRETLISCNLPLGNNPEEQRKKKKKSQKRVEAKKSSRKIEKPVKKQLRNKRNS